MKKCLANGCQTSILCRMLCSRHYTRWRRGVDEFESLGGRFSNYRTKERGQKCPVDGCQRNIGESGSAELCSAHYQRHLKYGKVFADRPILKRDGLPYLDREGYIMHKKKFQHRTIMEKKIGRLLKKTETVHHKNGDRADNRIINLELWSTAQPRGQRVSDKILFALEIIKTYGKNPNKYE